MTKAVRNLLDYGIFVRDDEIETKDGNYIRIRIIKYNNKFYYHKMVNGETISVCCLE